MRTLHQCLLDADIVRLRTIARFWDMELKTARRPEAADQLAAALVAPEAIAQAWDALPQDRRQALEALLAAGGKMPLRVFIRRWGEIRTMGPGRMEREQPWRDPVSTAEALWYTGFIARAFEQGREGAYEIVFVPAELQRHLPKPPTPTPTIDLKPFSPPAIEHSSGDALLDDACTALAYLQNEQVRPDPDRAWPERHRTRLARRLRDPAPSRQAFLYHLIHRLDWLRTTDAGRLRPEPGPVFAWLQSPVEQQRSTLAAAWRDDPTWNDLFHVPSLEPDDTGAWHNDPLLARQAILRHLRACAPGIWYTLDDFAAAIRQADPDFQRPGGDYTTWYIRDATTGAYLSGFESWNAIEGALIRYVIRGALAWLGLVDLGAAAPAARVTAFRLTPAGAAFLGLAEPPPQPEPPLLALRPDFTMLVPPARRYERFQLARVASWVASPLPPTRGTAPFPPTRGAKGGLPPIGGIKGGQSQFLYRLTPSSLERARRQGIPVARVLEFLAEITTKPLPRFVEAALTRWDSRGAEVQLERTVVLRVSSAELMEQIASSPITRQLLGERIGPTAALVRDRDWPRLVKALGELGLLPDVIALE